MRLPRDVSADQLIKALKVLGYEATRQTGSHIRLSILQPRKHHLTIPNHKPVRVGTLAAILDDVAAQLKLSREELIKLMDL